MVYGRQKFDPTLPALLWIGLILLAAIAVLQLMGGDAGRSNSSENVTPYDNTVVVKEQVPHAR